MVSVHKSKRGEKILLFFSAWMFYVPRGEKGGLFFPPLCTHYKKFGRMTPFNYKNITNHNVSTQYFCRFIVRDNNTLLYVVTNNPKNK